MRYVDVLIIGGGQAGLATAHYLKQSNQSFLVLEKNARLGDNWRNRYDSLVLFASRRYSHIPGLKLQGDQAGYPCKDEVGNYLERYAQHFDLPLALGCQIISVEQRGQGFLATYQNHKGVELQLSCRAVVSATGGFQKPNRLPCAAELAANIPQFTPENYQRPSQIPSGKVLIVGDGATGRQVAKELSGSHSVTLATGHKRPVKPQQILGKDYFWWLDKLGLLKVNKHSWLGRYTQKHPPFPGNKLQLRHLKQAGVQIHGKLGNISDDKFEFENGEKTQFNSVIWAMGYHSDYSWLKLPSALDAKGDLKEERGVVNDVAGLYCIGKPWQWTRGSATLTGVGDDAEYIADHITEYLAALNPSAIEFGQLEANLA